MKKEATTSLRCRPGDLARIKKAWNVTLVDQIVLIRRPYTDSEWFVTLLAGPALAFSEDRSRLIVTRTMIADDWALEPLRGERSLYADEIMDSVAPAALLRLEASSTSI